MNGRYSTRRIFAFSIAVWCALSCLARASHASPLDDPRPPGRVELRDRSSAAPVIAAAIGGLVLGAAIASSAAHRRSPEAHASLAYRQYQQPSDHVASCEAAALDRGPLYRFFDTYTHQEYVSLNEGRLVTESEGRTAVVRVIETRTGECVWTLCWLDGAWATVAEPRFAVTDERGRFEERYERRWQDRSRGRGQVRHDESACER